MEPKGKFKIYIVYGNIIQMIIIGKQIKLYIVYGCVYFNVTVWSGVVIILSVGSYYRKTN